ncbi:MAG: alpha/beta fold hydrolase [Polyangiales bacterium]
MIREPVSFSSAGVRLQADLYRPARGLAVPAVVTAPGFGGVKEMLIPRYAEALARAGIACLAFDYAGFGASEGAPRQHVDPPAQARAFRDALDALAVHPAIDAARLGVWGTSLSGGHALVTAADDARVRACVALIPFVGVPPVPEPRYAYEVARDALRRALGRPRSRIAAAGAPGSRAVMRSDGAAAWMQAMTRDAPSYRNEVTVASLWNMARYTTASAARTLTVPTRVVLATRDTITPAARVRAAFAGRSGPTLDFVEFPETHFELFEQHLDATVTLTVDWFTQHLLAEQGYTDARLASQGAARSS